MTGQRGRNQSGKGACKGGGMGAAGNCICVKCGYSAAKKPGIPCTQLKCPHCGAALMREGSKHHEAAVQRKK